MNADGHEGAKRPHKIPVPTNYRCAAKYLRMATEERKSIKDDLYSNAHFRNGKQKMNRILHNLPHINAIIDMIDLKTKEPMMNLCMARVLIFELLFGGGTLIGASRPVECIRGYETEIRAAFEETKADNPTVEPHKVPRYVRINTSLLNVEGAKRLLQEEGWFLVDEEFSSYEAFLDRVRALGNEEYLVDFHFNDLLVFPSTSRQYWALVDESVKKNFFLQNKACLIPTYLLKPAKKSVVLDMCAAPGLKATHLASLMKNKGRLYAVERDPERYKLLCKFAADFGVIKTICDDCLNITDEQVPGVEYILIDPSCSGSGMLDRVSALETVDEARLNKLAGLQIKMLKHGMNSFPNVRRIVYSTCSKYTAENEEVVQTILRRNSNFKLLDAREELGKHWHNVGSSDFPGVGERCIYARTEMDLTIGMFVAVFERCAEGERNDVYVAFEQQKLRSEYYTNPEGNDSAQTQQRKRKHSEGFVEQGGHADFPEWHDESHEEKPKKSKKKKNRSTTVSD